MEFRRLGFEEQHQVRPGHSQLPIVSSCISTGALTIARLSQRHLQMIESGIMPILSEHEQKMQDEYEMNRFDYLDFEATGI